MYVCREGCEGVDSASLDHSLFLATFQMLSFNSVQHPSPEHRGLAHAGCTCAERAVRGLIRQVSITPFSWRRFKCSLSIPSNTPVLSIGVWLTPDVRVQRGL